MANNAASSPKAFQKPPQLTTVASTKREAKKKAGQSPLAPGSAGLGPMGVKLSTKKKSLNNTQSLTNLHLQLQLQKPTSKQVFDVKNIHDNGHDDVASSAPKESIAQSKKYSTSMDPAPNTKKLPDG